MLLVKDLRIALNKIRVTGSERCFIGIGESCIAIKEITNENGKLHIHFDYEYDPMMLDAVFEALNDAENSDCVIIYKDIGEQCWNHVENLKSYNGNKVIMPLYDDSIGW